MTRLTLFGALELVDAEGRSIQSVVQQPKRLGLLAYLTLAGPGAFRRRQTIFALFWPEATESQARRALNQTVHMLRRSLGADVLVSRGADELATSPGALWCDAAAFKQALARGNRSGALDLYRGDLLPGFFIGAGPEFEQWLDSERDRLRRRAAQAARELAESAERSGELEAAAVYARRSVELSQNNERVVQNLLRLLDRIGDRAGALHAFDAFAAQLGREYDAEPSAETRELVDQIRARADPAAAPATSPARHAAGGLGVLPSHGAGLQVETPSGPDRRREPEGPLPPGTTSFPIRKRRRAAGPGATGVRSRVLAVVAILPCVMGAWGLALTVATTSRGAGTEEQARASVTVEGIVNLGAPNASADLGQVLTNAVFDQLADKRSFDVIAGRTPRSGQARAAGDARPPHLAPPRLVLRGGVLQAAGVVRVSVQVVDAASRRLVGSATLEHPAGEPLPVVDVLAREVASVVQASIGREVKRREWGRLASEKGYDLMEQADDDWTRATRLAQAGEFPTAARALASADSLLRGAALEAPGTNEPMVERAHVLERLAGLYLAPPFRDPARAEAFLRRGIGEASRALSMERGDAAALEALGSLSYWYWLTVPLPPDSARRLRAQAERSLRAAVTSEPARASAWSLLSASLFARADYAGAYLAADRAYQADAYLDDAQEILGRLFLTSYEVGADSASRAWCDEINHRFGRSWTGAYCRMSLLAWNGSGGDRDVELAWRLATDDYLPPHLGRQMQPRLQMLVAAVLARSGLRDSAEAVIGRTRALGGADPELLPLEADARMLLRQSDVAVELLDRYVNGKPVHRMGVMRSRRFTALGKLPRSLQISE